MMKAIYESVERRLLTVDGIKSVSLYNGDVKTLERALDFPAALILFDTTNYSDGGQGYQWAEYTLVVYILAKGVHKEVLEVLDLVNRVAQGLHMFQPTESSGTLLRESEAMPDAMTDLFVFEQRYKLSGLDTSVMPPSDSSLMEGVVVRVEQ